MTFQCWFYECFPYANNILVVRVGESVPRILNWSVTIIPNYKKVKSEFSDINREQVVLTNIKPTYLEKSILQLPLFEPVPQQEHAANMEFGSFFSKSKQHMREEIPVDYENELKLLRTDLNLVCVRVLKI